MSNTVDISYVNTIITGLNNSVIGNNLNCTNYTELDNTGVLVTPYLGLINLRKMKQKATKDNTVSSFTTVGRLTGANVKFNIDNGPSYEDYKMRRKAEVLKYRNGINAPGIILSNKNNFNSIIKNKGNYSSAQLKQIMLLNNGNIPDNCIETDKIWVVSTPSQSGVHDYKTRGYYLDPYITYYPSL